MIKLKKNGISRRIFMNLHESAEMYLETIYVLSKKGAVRSIDVAEEMGYSKPSVSRAVGLLKKGGYLTVDGVGNLVLTETGEEKARSVFERHTVLAEFLVGLGISAEVASDDACKIEHVISTETLDAIKIFTEKNR